MSQYPGLIMIYRKTATIWCRSIFFRSHILHKSLLILLFQVFHIGFHSIRADDQVLIGELVQWDLKIDPVFQKIQPILNPQNSGIIHTEIDTQDRQKIHFYFVPSQAGQLVIETPASPNIKKFRKIMLAKQWPLDPPSTGIRAGVGKIAGQWIQPPSKPEVGEMIRFTLRLEGDAAMAIRSAPKLVVMHNDLKIDAHCLGFEQSWPSIAGGSSQSWTYEVPASSPGLYRIQPLRIHTWDKSGQTLQTKLISGIQWEVAARPHLDLQSAPKLTAPEHPKIFTRRVLLLFTGTLIFLLATIYQAWRLGLFHWVQMHIGLYQASACKDPHQARIWYRRLKPLWAKTGFAQKNGPPKWRALDQSRMDALERLAFGKPADQNPIR